MAGIGGGTLLGTALCGLFFAPSDSHHARGHLKKLHLKMRGVFLPPPIPTNFLPPPIPTTPAGIWKNRVAKIEKMLVK
jgi:hypothetical protein